MRYLRSPTISTLRSSPSLTHPARSRAHNLCAFSSTPAPHTFAPTGKLSPFAPAALAFPTTSLLKAALPNAPPAPAKTVSKSRTAAATNAANNIHPTLVPRPLKNSANSVITATVPPAKLLSQLTTLAASVSPPNAKLIAPKTSVFYSNTHPQQSTPRNPHPLHRLPILPLPPTQNLPARGPRNYAHSSAHPKNATTNSKVLIPTQIWTLTL